MEVKKGDMWRNKANGYFVEIFDQSEDKVFVNNSGVGLSKKWFLKTFEPVSDMQKVHKPDDQKSSNNLKIIGITGVARSGKDTTADKLLELLGGEWRKASFAEPIKAMLSAIGVDCSDDNKTKIVDGLNATPRKMMQTLGTEWGRQIIDGDIWVNTFKKMNNSGCVIVSDVRFENEADLVRQHGVLIHITGRGGIEGNHISENHLNFKKGDVVIDNSRDLEWLYSQIEAIASLERQIEMLEEDA